MRVPRPAKHEQFRRNHTDHPENQTKKPDQTHRSPRKDRQLQGEDKATENRQHNRQRQTGSNEEHAINVTGLFDQSCVCVCVGVCLFVCSIDSKAKCIGASVLACGMTSYHGHVGPCCETCSCIKNKKAFSITYASLSHQGSSWRESLAGCHHFSVTKLF